LPCILCCRHQHFRFVNIQLRIVKTGTSTVDVMSVRIFSYFSSVTAKDVEELGSDAHVQCPSEHLNVPQLFMTLLLFACSAPGVGVDMGMLHEQPLFPSMLARSVSGAVSFFKRRSETEINARLIADLGRIGMAFMNGKRACRMYGFRRGGAQFLLDLTGKFEQVMRLVGLTVTSSSILSFLTAMNGRGTLRSTLRSFRRDEVMQIVAQFASTYSRWTVGVVKGVVHRAMGETGEVDHAVLASLEEENVKVLCTLLTEYVLELRNGKEEDNGREEESVEEDCGEDGETEGGGDEDKTDSE